MPPSDARRLVVAKQQLLMYANGLEIEGAHHPWSKDKHTYTGYELLEDHKHGHAVGKGIGQKRTAANGTHCADEKLACGALSWNYVGSSSGRSHFGEGGDGQV